MRDVKVKDSNNKFFTVEFFGVAIIVATFLLLVALLFGKSVLFELGAEVQSFLYGFSGYFSYPLLIALNYVGFMMLLGKKIQKSSTKTNVKFTILFLLAVLCLLTTISGARNAVSYGEYLRYAFEAGRNGLSNAVAGGWLFSLVTYPVVKLIKYVGAIIFFSVFTVLTIVLYVVKRKNAAVKTEGVRAYPGKLPGESVNDSAKIVNGSVRDGYTNSENGVNKGYLGGQNAFNSGAYNQGAYNGGRNGIYPQNTGLNRVDYTGYGDNGQPTVSYRNDNGYRGDYSPNQSGAEGVNYQFGNNNGVSGGFSGYNQGYSTGAGENNPRFLSVDGQRRYGNDDTFIENMRTIYGKPVTYSEAYRSDFDPQKKVESFGASDEIEQTGEVSEPINKNTYGNENNYLKNEYTSKEEAFKKIDEEYSDKDYSIDLEDPFSAEEDKPKVDVKKFFEGRAKKEVAIFADKAKTEYTSESSTVDSYLNNTVNGGDALDGFTDDGRKMIEKMPINYVYTPPPIRLLKSVDTRESDSRYEVYSQTIINRILSTLSRFGVETNIAQSFRGPAVSRFDIEVPDAVPMKKITQLYDDINLRVKASSAIRMIAPVPNTDYVGIEVPNEKPDSVALKELIASPYFDTSKPSSLNFILGKDIVGKPVCLDLAEMPHVLVSGTTGSGKSVCINSMISSLIFRYSPAELRFIIVDPKKVDFVSYQNLPHMLFDEIIEDVPVVNAMLTWAVNEMNERYRILRERGVKKLSEYNAKAITRGEKLMHRLVIIIDEFADLMKQDQRGIGDKICMLAQKSRAAGIHLVLVAQRPSADIVEGPIKSNLPARLVFKASSKTDSLVSLGATGAETLVGRGDCLYKTATMMNIERAMGAFVSDDEVEAVVKFVEKNNDAYYDYNAWSKIMSTVSSNMQQDDKGRTDLLSGGSGVGAPHSDADELWIKAMQECYREGGISGSFLVRRLSIGSNRAARIVDWLVDNGYVSAKAEGGKRKPLYTQEEFERKISEENNG